MELKAILEAIGSSCDGKQGSAEVQLPAELLLAAQKELKDKAQMARDLEMARDEASMKPSVARKLNEKIRALEAEVEELRSNKKVKELEKKVQFLEHELKQSYTTKNFTLKSGLLELEKQYRAHMNVDPAMAAFWDDITVLLDEKKEREPISFTRGPRGTAPSAADGGGFRTPRLSSTAVTPTPSAPGTAPEQPAAAPTSEASPSSQAPPSPGKGADAAALERSTSMGIQTQVDTFNTLISEEAVSAAALAADLGSGKQDSGEMVVRHGAGFRVVRPAGAPDPQADVVATTGGPAATAPGAAGEQAVQLLAHDFASRCKDVAFHAMPASKEGALISAAAAAAAAAAKQQPTAATALEQQSQAVTARLQSALQHFSSLAAEATSLPQPPPLAGSLGGQQLPAQAGDVDTASLWQGQLLQLLASAQQLQQQQQHGPWSISVIQEQEATAAALCESVNQMQAVLQAGSSGADAADAAAQAAAAAAAQEVTALRQELLQLQQCQQRATAEAGGQQLLVSVFGEFLTQLEHQGVLTPGAAAAAAAATAASDRQQAQQPALLALLQSFLKANPHVPQMLAVQLAPALPASQEEQQQQQQELLQAEVSSSAVQAVADAEHREVQCEPWQGQHVSTQSDPLPRPADHVETQTDAAAGPSDHAQTQTDAAAGASGHAETQTDVVQPSISHVSTQAATESTSAGVQASPPTPVAAAVQAELHPEVSTASSQTDLHTSSAAAGEQQEPEAAAASSSAAAADDDDAGRDASSAAPPDSPRLNHSKRHGSGIIYSASGSELSVSKAALGQQLDILHRIERSRAGDAPGQGEGGAGAAAVVEVKPEELQDLDGVAKELGQLRADNVELAANLQVTQSLVDHLNTNLKTAIDKADDAEAEAMQTKQQLEATAASLRQLQSEHAEVTHVLIEAKVEIAEKKGELLKLVRDLRRAISNPVQNAAGVVKELENILAVVPSGDDDADVPASPALTASRQGSSFDATRQGGLAGLAAGFGHMRDALGGLGAALPAARTKAVGTAGPAASGTVEGASAAAAAGLVKSDSEQEKS